MKQDDRFFSIAGVLALLATVSAFLWFHQEAIFGIGRSARTTQRSETTVPIRTAAVPTPITPTAEFAARTARVTPVSPIAKPATIIPAAYEGEVEAGAGQWATDTESIDRIFDTVMSIAAGTTPGLGGDPPLSPVDVLVYRDRDDRLLVAPGTHQRYDRIVEEFERLETAAFAAAFDFFEIRWTEETPGEGDFQSVLTAALDHLLEVELPDVEPDMISKGTHWGFVDPEYDDLTAAQKHILLMGRHNARVVRSRLEEIRNLLGEPPPKVLPDPNSFFDDEVLIAEEDETTGTMTVTAPK